MWAFEECDNEDSCESGTTHLYPDPKSTVLVIEHTAGRVVGGTDTVQVPSGIQTVGKHVDHEGHMVSIEVNTHNLSALVWVDLDDLLPPSTLQASTIGNS